MNFLKVGIDDLEIMRRYRVQTRNYHVSVKIEEFTCGAHTVLVSIKLGVKDVNVGTGLKEHRISGRGNINGYLGCVNGGS